MYDNRLFQLKFHRFDRQKPRLDDFFFKVLDIHSHKELQSVVKLVLKTSSVQGTLEIFERGTGKGREIQGIDEIIDEHS